MNNTNRAVNRIVLLIVGIVAFALGAAVAVSAAWPPAAQLRDDIVRDAQSVVDNAVTLTQIGDGPANWIAIGALVVLLVIAAGAVAACTKLGGTDRHPPLRGNESQSQRGRISVSVTFISDALTEALRHHDDVLSARVTTHAVADVPVVHLNITPRSNTAPHVLLGAVDEMSENLTQVTGKAFPLFVSVHSTVRSRIAQDQHRT